MRMAGKTGIIPVLPLLLMLGAGPGCATYQHTASANLAAFNGGDGAKVIAYYTQKQTGRNKQLHMVEAGRLKLLEGDFEGSRQEFEKAIAEIFDREEGAVIRLRDTGGTVLSSTFLDDTTMPYNLPAFEAVFTFQQQALNWIFTGDISAAGVELRRAVTAQDLIAEQYEREVQKALDESTSQELGTGMEAVRTRYAEMGPVLGRAMSGFQNPYVWYCAGLMYEIQRDPGNAYLAYKKAWELSPDNPSLQRDLIRLSRTQNSEEWEQFKARFNVDPTSLDRDHAEIIVLYEEGLISQRYSVGLPIFLINSLQKISFPVYMDGPYQPNPAQVWADDREAGWLMPLAYVQSLAYHDLNDRMPGIAARNISRAITREIASRAGRQSDDAAVQLIALIGASFAAIADEADTRGWYSLPMAVQLLRAPVEPGERSLRINRLKSGTPLDIPVTLAPGEKKLIWIADLGPRTSYAVASLTHAGSSPVQFGRIIGGRQDIDDTM